MSGTNLLLILETEKFMSIGFCHFANGGDAPLGTFGLDDNTFEHVYELPTGYNYTFTISNYFGDGSPANFS